MSREDVALEDLETLRETGDGQGGLSAQHAAALEQLNYKKHLKSIVVPTDDAKVRAELRRLGEPITTFGEGPAERRQRLRVILGGSTRQGDQADGAYDSSSEDDDDASDTSTSSSTSEFYTPGSLELLKARQYIADYSVERARQRLARQVREFSLPLSQVVHVRKGVFDHVKSFTSLGSQIGDSRAISLTRFSPNSKFLLTGSWSGTIRRWHVPSCDPVCSYSGGHTDRVGGVAWHPRATLDQSPDNVNIVSGGGEGSVCLWSLAGEKPLVTMQSHRARVCRTEFHPTGRFVGSASYDGTWRLYDAEYSREVTPSTATRELLLQEGHSREVYSIAFQDDGALVGSGGLDCIGRIWDLRTGRTSMILDGHSGGIMGMDFHPNGYQIATGSADDTVKIWDMRATKCVYTIMAHRNLVSDVRFYRARSETRETHRDAEMTDPDATGESETSSTLSSSSVPLAGLVLVTSGYDGRVCLWSSDDWTLLKSLQGHEGKVMSVDISPSMGYIVSGGYDRLFRLWASDV